MAQTYTCLNYGSCSNAGVPQSGGVGATCPNCGGMMLAQGKSRKSRSPGAALKWVLIAALSALVLLLAWKLTPSGIGFVNRQHDIIGRWRADQTTIMGAALPIGPALEFGATSATVLQSQVAVTAYDRDGDRVHVVMPSGAGLEVTFTFRFEGPDKIVYEGPLGISMRYRRIKDAP